MDHLRRDLAPISTATWAAIETEASRSLAHFLGMRPLIDVSGPHGWQHSADSLGRAETIAPPIGPLGGSGAIARLRRVQPLVELRTAFTLSREETDAIDRGAEDPDLHAVTEAARHAAATEDSLIVDGYPAAGITGIAPGAPRGPLKLGDDYSEYPGVVARAVALLRTAGIGGGYGIALGTRAYTGVVETTERGGYPVLEHIRLILGGPVIWAPAVEGAIVVSLRGGDYRLVCGEDFSIGYAGHDETSVDLYLEESVTFHIVEPSAAVALTHLASTP
jgi:uncharacterized linocin/CFP29 family protein